MVNKRIINQGASNHMQYIDGRVENKKNTVPFDIELISLLNHITEEELVEHLNNLLKVNITIVNEEEEEE